MAHAQLLLTYINSVIDKVQTKAYDLGKAIRVREAASTQHFIYSETYIPWNNRVRESGLVWIGNACLVLDNAVCVGQRFTQSKYKAIHTCLLCVYPSLYYYPWYKVHFLDKPQLPS